MSAEYGNLVGTAVPLQKLLDVQAGAVVSRTVLKKKTGTVTVFAFDEGEGLSEHKAPFDALVYVIEGKVEIRLAGVAQRVAAGEMLIMPKDVPHALKALTKFKMLLVMIRSEDDA